MFDHISIQCHDPVASAAFFDAVLGSVGGKRVLEFGLNICYGYDTQPIFVIGPQETGQGFRETHIAFSAPDRGAVRAFFNAAARQAADILHEPRLWPEYHPNYYAVFVRDPDGNNIEAVCHAPG
jgi:catechol 2,3-dioxygenase-like lactoylglutathione lyase family enzyme